MADQLQEIGLILIKYVTLPVLAMAGVWWVATTWERRGWRSGMLSLVLVVLGLYWAIMAVFSQ